MQDFFSGGPLLLFFLDVGLRKHTCRWYFTNLKMDRRFSLTNSTKRSLNQATGPCTPPNQLFYLAYSLTFLVVESASFQNWFQGKPTKIAWFWLQKLLGFCSSNDNYLQICILRHLSVVSVGQYPKAQCWHSQCSTPIFICNFFIQKQAGQASVPSTMLDPSLAFIHRCPYDINLAGPPVVQIKSDFLLFPQVAF